MKGQAINRRRFLQGCALALGGAIAAACAPAPQATEKEVTVEKEVTKVVDATKVVQETVVVKQSTIDFWWGWNPEQIVKPINQAVDLFMERNPDVKVRTAQHEWGEKIVTAFAAGMPPDVLNMLMPTQYACKGSLIPLDDYLDKSKNLSRASFPDEIWREGLWQGKIYGVPQLEHFLDCATIVNSDIWAEVGLKIPDDMPVTREEVLEQAKEYTQYDDAGNIKRLWMGIRTDVPYEWGAAWGVHAYDADAMKFNFDDPAWAEILDWLNRYYQTFGPDRLEAFSQTYPGWAVPGCAMCSGVMVGYTDGYWACGDFAHSAPDKHYAYSWMPVPESRRGKKVHLQGSQLDMIPKDARDPDAAWRLMEFLASNEALKIMYQGCGFLVGTNEFIKDPKSVTGDNVYPGLDWWIDTYTQVDEMWVYDANPIFNFTGDGFLKAIDSVVYKEKTVSQALADLQASCTDELAKTLAPA